MSREAVLKWRSWPLVERPLVSLALISFLVLLALVLWNLTVIQWESPFFYYLGMLLVLGNLLPYFIPTEYEMFEDGILVKYLIIKIQRKYSDFGCFYKDKRGIMLSTFKLPRRLDAFRGQSLRFSASKSEVNELMAILSSKIGKQY